MYKQQTVNTGSSRNSGYDADAEAYFTNANITNDTEKNLYNAFVIIFNIKTK